MAESIPAFEAELIQKITYKASSKTSVDAFLFKNLRFFDMGDKGFLSKLDFFKGIAKCGVVIDTHNMDSVYENYASPDGKIYYKTFIEQLLFRQEQIESNSSRFKQTHQKPLQEKHNNKNIIGQSQLKQSHHHLAQSKINKIYNKCETYTEVLDYFKRKLQEDGYGSLANFAVKLKMTDPKKLHVVNRKTLQTVAPCLEGEHLQLIFKEISENNKDVDYSVLVYDLKGQVEEDRLKDIQGAFNLLDNRREGEFPINYMVSRFLNKSESEQFQNAIDLYAKFQGIDDGVFTEDDFSDCLGFLSFDFNSNESFRSHIIRPFYEEDRSSVSSQRSNRSRDFQNKSQIREPVEALQVDFRKNKDSPIAYSQKQKSQDNYEQFPEDRQEKKSVSRYSQLQTKQVNESQMRDIESIIMRVKKRLATKGSKGFLLFEKALKNSDLDKDTLLTYEQFKQVIKDQRIDITNTEIDHIFNIFDEQCTNLISFPEFMFTLRGKMPQTRKDYVDRLWHQIMITEQTTNFGKVRRNLNFRNHPDVQAGRKFQEDIWKEIQETILNIQELNGTPRSDTISRPEFEEYLENLSLSIIDDRLFESILQNFWRLQSSVNISEKYAGSRKVFQNTKNCYLLDHHRNVVNGGSVSQNAPFGTSVQPTNYWTQHHRL